MEDKPRVVRLNNDFTNSQIQQASRPHRPKIRYLGLILLVTVVVLTIPAYGLVLSFHDLQSTQRKNSQTVQQSKDLQAEAASKSAMIENMKNNYYAQKYARAQYNYTAAGEKNFVVPNNGTQGQATADGTPTVGPTP